jgi:hypothetical protein
VATRCTRSVAKNLVGRRSNVSDIGECTISDANVIVGVSSASGVRRESKSSGRDRREKSACTSMVPRSADSRETRGYSNTAHLSVEQNTPVAGRVPVRRRQIVESESGESHVSAAHDP